MEPRLLLQELRGVAEALGVEVRIQAFRRSKSADARVFCGGLCWLRGRAVAILDGNASVVEQAFALADALAELSLPPVPMSAPVLRALRAARARRAGAPGEEPAPRTAGPPLRPKPLAKARRLYLVPGGQEARRSARKR